MEKSRAYKRRKLKEAFVVGVSLAPASVILMLFMYIAFIYCAYLSLNKWDMIRPIRWVGLQNYVTAFTFPDFWNSVKVTLIYVAFSVPGAITLGLLIGVLLDRITIATSFFRLMLFLPVITSMVVAAVIWRWIFDPTIGFLNYILISLGVEPTTWMRWTQDPGGGAMASVLTVGIWKRAGYNGVLFLAGLKAVPRQLYEAAIIDGAGGWHKFRRITLPLLSPTTFLVTMLQVMSAFKVIESILVMTLGGPLKSTEALVVHLYHHAFDYYKMGYASAVSVILFLIILAVTIGQLIVEKRMVHYQ